MQLLDVAYTANEELMLSDNAILGVEESMNDLHVRRKLVEVANLLF